MRQNIETAILGMYSAMARAAAAQAANGRADQGRRSAVTSGKHLDPVAGIIRNDLIDLGFHEDEVFHTGRACTLPGWFRPTKDWDLLALDDGELVSAIELKSISSSFGNNANNRAEESIGSVVDAIEAYNERLYGNCSIPPVLGYAMIVCDCDESRSTSARPAHSPHFDIDEAFKGVSYLDRFHILCDRLRRKSLYNAVWLVFARPDEGIAYEPDPSMTYEVFMTTIESGLRMHRAQR